MGRAARIYKNAGICIYCIKSSNLGTMPRVPLFSVGVPSWKFARSPQSTRPRRPRYPAPSSAAPGLRAWLPRIAMTETERNPRAGAGT